MTTVDVTYRFGATPSEATALAIGAMREVYGVRRVDVKQLDKTVTVEYDSTRLTEAVIHQFLRRAGVDVTVRVQQYTVPPPAQPAV